MKPSKNYIPPFTYDNSDQTIYNAIGKPIAEVGMFIDDINEVDSLGEYIVNELNKGYKTRCLIQKKPEIL